MKHAKLLRWLVVGSIFGGCLMLGVRPPGAAEEARRFLDGLRERGLYDMALEYLEQMRTSPLCPDELKEAIDYEAGVTLVTSAW